MSNKNEDQVNPIEVTQKEGEKKEEGKKETTDKKEMSDLLKLFLGLIPLGLVTFLLDKWWNLALASGVGFILLVLYIGILSHIFERILKIGLFIVFGALLVIIIIFIPSHPIIGKLVYTPTPTPTAFPTCADITCPTVESTPCPTYEITPCPTCEVAQIPVEPTRTQPVPSPTPTVPWNFRDGCIFDTWLYIPDTWEYKVEDDEACGGYDYSFFGFEAKKIEGLDVLSIRFPSADDIYNFGIFRYFPEDLSYIKLEFTVENLINGLESATYFNIGFGKTSDFRNFEGPYFRFYNTSTYENNNLKMLDELHPDYENNEKWLGFIEKGSKVTIECDDVSHQKIICDYKLNGLLKGENIEVYPPLNWDGLYIGYEMPKGGTIEIHIDEIVVYQ